MNSGFRFRLHNQNIYSRSTLLHPPKKPTMEETLSTFPTFDQSLNDCKNDWEKAQAQYFIKVTTWHQKLTQQVVKLLENKKTELDGLTAEMVLQELLGKKP
jgi:hypothetical protein